AQVNLNAKLRRFRYAANSMNVLLHIFDQIPSTSQEEVLNTFGSLIQQNDIDPYLNAIHVGNLFKVLHQMRANLREPILLIYAQKLMNSSQDLDRVILEEFLANKDILTDSI